jgi:hypothetical protein
MVINSALYLALAARLRQVAAIPIQARCSAGSIAALAFLSDSDARFRNSRALHSSSSMRVIPRD